MTLGLFACVITSLGHSVLVERVQNSESVKLSIRAEDEFYHGELQQPQLSRYLKSFLQGNPIAYHLVKRHLDRWVSDALYMAPKLVRSEPREPAITLMSGSQQFICEPDSHIDRETGQAWPALGLRTQLPSGHQVAVMRPFQGGDIAYVRRDEVFKALTEERETHPLVEEMYLELREKLPLPVKERTSETFTICSLGEQIEKVATC